MAGGSPPEEGDRHDAGGAPRPTLFDVARVSGLSIATVDRVINNRGNVSTRSVRKVIHAAEELRLNRFLPAPHKALVNIEVIVRSPTTAFFIRLNDALQRIAQSHRRRVVIHRTFIEDTDPQKIATRISTSKAEGLVIMSQQHVEIERAIKDATRRGAPVISLGSDLPGTDRQLYVGIDHERAGRAVASLMLAVLAGRNQIGRIVVACHSLPYSAHGLRLHGFLARLAEGACAAEVEVLRGPRASDIAEELDRTAHAGKPLSGFYNTTQWDDTLRSVLSRTSKMPGHFSCGHELSSQTIEMLRTGELAVVIDQRAELQALRAVNAILDFHEGRMPTEGRQLDFSIHTHENAATSFDQLGTALAGGLLVG